MTTKCVRMQKDYTKILYLCQDRPVCPIRSLPAAGGRWDKECKGHWTALYLMQTVADQSDGFQTDLEISMRHSDDKKKKSH